MSLLGAFPVLPWSAPMYLLSLAALAGALAGVEEVSAPARAAGAVQFRDGRIEESQVAAWLAFSPPSRRLSPEEGRRERISHRVVLEILARRFGELGLDADLEAQAWHRRLERRLAVQALRASVLKEAEPSAAEVEVQYQADPQVFYAEKRWRLRNLYKRFPVEATAEQREALRHELDALRQRALAGEDFAALAAAESDSATRTRGGALGTTTLSALEPRVAAVVARLEAGQISPIVETEHGLSLLLCTSVVAEQRPNAAESKRRIAAELRGQRFESEWPLLETRLSAELAAQYDLAPLPASPSGVIVRMSAAGETFQLSRIDLDVALREHGLDALSGVAAERARSIVEGLVREVALAREATRRGLTAIPAHQDRLAFETLEMRAELALAPAIRDRLSLPSEEAVRTAWEENREHWVERAQLKLRSLQIPIRPDIPRELYQRLEQLEPRIQAGELSLEQLRDLWAPHAVILDLGWLSEPQAWQLGRNVEAALQDLAPGGVTAPVQEGRRLLVLHLLARVDERPLTFEEARPQIERNWLGREKRRLRRELFAAIAAEQEIRPAL